MGSTFSAATSSLLFLTTRLFKDVSIVKPMSSRVTGPERYLVAFGFNGSSSKEVAVVLRAMQRAHGLVGGASPLLTPLLSPLVRSDELARDSVFTQAARTMGSQLCERQQTALNAVVDRADFLEKMALGVADALEANQRSKANSEGQENQLPVEQIVQPSVDNKRRNHLFCVGIAVAAREASRTRPKAVPKVYAPWAGYEHALFF